jgi:hypothetical protein
MGKGSLNHNNRVFSAENVTPSLSHNNIIFRQERLEDAYAHLFGKALDNYNAKQKRNDRKIPDYLEHILKSKNGEKDFYEIIFQVGDRYDTAIGTPEADSAKIVLSDFYHGFLERNPNLYVFNSVLHMDEADGTPHLHIDFIPFASGNKRGLETKNSMKAAMEAQGFAFQSALSEPDAPADNREFTQRFGGGRWLDAERSALAAELEAHGIKHEEKGVKRGNLSVAEYKACAEIVDKELSRDRPVKIKSRAPTLPQKIAGLRDDDVIVSRSSLDALKKENSKLRAQTELHRKAVRAIEQDRERERSDNQSFAKTALDKQTLADEAEAKFSVGTAEKYSELETKFFEAVNRGDTLSEDYDSLQGEYSRFKRNFDLQVEQAVDEVKKPLEVKIEALQRDVEYFRSIAEDLFDRLKKVCRLFVDTLRAVFLLKYDSSNKADEKYRSELTPDAERLINVLESNARQTLEEVGATDIVQDLDTMTVKPFAQDLKPRQREYGMEM